MNPPPGAKVIYSTNQGQSATSFSVQLGTLQAPANWVGSSGGSEEFLSGGQPTLGIERVDNNCCPASAITVSWDAAVTGFILEVNPEVATTGWRPVPNLPVALPGNRQGVTLTNDRVLMPDCFFRLRSVDRCAAGTNVYSANAIPDGFLGWSTLFVEDTTPDGTLAVYSVGRRVGESVLYDLGPGYTSVPVGHNGLDLSGINPAYTNLVLRAELATISGTNKPCLDAWRLTYHSTHWLSFTYTVRVDDRGQVSCGELQIDNSVQISTPTPEITEANNTASYSMATRLTDLEVQCEVSATAALPGETLTYTVDWQVLGPQSAPHAFFQVVLPSGDDNALSLLTVSPGPDVTAYYHPAPSAAPPPPFDPNNPLANGWRTDRADANHIVFQLVGDRAPHSAGSIQYTARLNESAAGQTLCGSVDGHVARRETQCDNNRCSTCTVIGSLANVFVANTPVGCLHPGTVVTLRIPYGNNGNTSAVNVVVTDILPEGLTFSDAFPVPTTGVGQTLTWANLGTSPGTLGAGEFGEIRLQARVAENYALVGQSLVNVATISTSSGEVSLADNRAPTLLGCFLPALTSLGGYVYLDRNCNGLRELALSETGIADVVIRLIGIDVLSNAVTLTTLTDRDGQYNFSGLNPGTYAVMQVQPATLVSTADTLGTVNGMPRGTNSLPLDDQLEFILLRGGEAGLEYNFGENLDQIPPRINCPSDIVTDAEPGRCFRIVTFTTTSTDNCDTNPVVSCTPASGSMFDVGTNLVSCTAIDAAGNSNRCSFIIIVRDHESPAIACPSSIVLCPDPGQSSASEVSYSVTATDNCPEVSFRCEPPPGATFAAGTSPVLCTATDAAGNTNACSFLVTVQVPTTATVLSDLTRCRGESALFATTTAGTGPFSYAWTLDGNEVGASDSTLSVNTASLSVSNHSVGVVVTGACGSVTNRAMLTVRSCAEGGPCSFTQGFYGNPNGKFNGTPSLTLVGNLLAQGPLVVGKSGSRSLTIPVNAALLLQQKLPGNGTPTTLESGDSVLSPTTPTPTSKGKFANVLLGQTVTLSLNVRLNTRLLGVVVRPTFCSQGVLPGPDGLRGTADDQLVSTDILMFNTPASVLTALSDPVLGINNVTVQGLLELANRGLAGLLSSGPSLPDINAAVDAINRGYDGCRVLVDCATHTVILDSFNDSFATRPVLTATNSTGMRVARGLQRIAAEDAASELINIRTRVSNLLATKEASEPDLAGNPGGKSVWWQWPARQTGLVTIQTDGSSFDTLLGVYVGSSLSTLTPVASNDDLNDQTTAAVTFDAQAGTDYQIVVDGFDGDSGTIELTILVGRPRLSLLVLLPNDEVQMTVDGEPGRTYTIEASSDLVTWKPIASLENNDGTLRFSDAELRNYSQRFYRVVVEM